MLPSRIKALILDMDGVLWKSDAPIGNLPAIFDRIRSRGLGFVFATNNGTKTPEQYAQKLAEFGVTVEPAQVLTSALCVAHMLERKFPRGSRVFVIGGDGIRAALKEKGFEILAVEGALQADAFVMGIDRTIDFTKMSEATLLVRRGIPFYATNPDKTFPTPRGEIPGAGAWISVITTAAGVEPIYAGKPYPYLMEMALERLGTEKGETLIVGDRLETDIVAGQVVGCPTALLLSGVSTEEQAKSWKPEPNFIVKDLEALVG
ncbi:MAG: HAD-IIA family hydrolase [Chloroflexota bacterium]